MGRVRRTTAPHPTHTKARAAPNVKPRQKERNPAARNIPRHWQRAGVSTSSELALKTSTRNAKPSTLTHTLTKERICYRVRMPARVETCGCQRGVRTAARGAHRHLPPCLARSCADNPQLHAARTGESAVSPPFVTSIAFAKFTNHLGAVATT